MSEILNISLNTSVNNSDFNNPSTLYSVAGAGKFTGVFTVDGSVHSTSPKDNAWVEIWIDGEFWGAFCKTNEVSAIDKKYDFLYRHINNYNYGFYVDIEFQSSLVIKYAWSTLDKYVIFQGTAMLY